MTTAYAPPEGVEAAKTFEKPETLGDVKTHWCPGCGHGSVAQLIASAIEELDLRERVILAGGVGCGTAITSYLDVHAMACPHGRASDVATGISRMMPDKIVFQYSGDGDAYAIGLAGLIHACNRRENFLVFVYNNNVYGMTGGQIGPTTAPVIPTTTFQNGRPEDVMGFPMDIMQMVRHLPGVAYAARISTATGPRLIQGRKVIMKAFQTHLAGHKGIKIVDCIGNCNVNWKGGDTTFTPQTANTFIEEKLYEYFPLGEFKTTDA